MAELELDTSKVRRGYTTVPYKRKAFVKKVGGNIVLENDHARVTISPQCGGKICSFISKTSGNEFFYKDKRGSFDSTRGYSYHDISGFDECFPTITPVKFKIKGQKNFQLPDHGYLWSNPWSVNVQEDKVLMLCDLPELQCRFKRTCRLEDNSSFRLDYSIFNYGNYDLPYIYSAHPLLKISENSLIELPGNDKKVYIHTVSENAVLKNDTWVHIDSLKKIFPMDSFRKNKNVFVKFFINKPSANWVVIHKPNIDEFLKISFDTINLPYLGIFINEGFDCLDDGAFKRELLLGIEPTTSIGDDLITAEKNKTIRYLSPKEEVNFHISLIFGKHGA